MKKTYQRLPESELDIMLVLWNGTPPMTLYTPLISQTDYQAHESQSVLEKLYGNSLKKFVTSLYQGKKISSEEIHELSDFLKEIEDREE